MNKHVPTEVSYKAARALAYLMTRKWWKELKDIYNIEEDRYQQSGLEIEDYILANANESILGQLIFWPDGKESTWSKRNTKFRELWNNNFNSEEGKENTVEEKRTGDPTFKVGDKVRIKERTEDKDRYWGCFVDSMADLAGKIYAVKGVSKIDRSSDLGCLPDDGYFYDLDGERHVWASSMLEKVE